jgi:ABC-2 type transport system permease protein
MATPTSRSALVIGKAFAASVRAIAQVLVVLVLSLILGVHLDWNAFHVAMALLLIVLRVGLFTTLSISADRTGSASPVRLDRGRLRIVRRP